VADERKFREALVRSVDPGGIDRRRIDRAAAQASVAGLSIDDLASIIHGELMKQRVELVEHIDRIRQVLTLKIESKNPRDEVRAGNFHKRLCELESDVRQLQSQLRGQRR
jgi:hypothetical protein